MSYTITNNIMYVRDDTGELVPVSMIASGADQTIQAIKDTAATAESQIDTKVTDANAAIETKTNEQAARIPEVTALAEDVNGLKDEKLDKTPGTWPAWTADEQKAARERMGAAEAFKVGDGLQMTGDVLGVKPEGVYELIGTITVEEEVAIISADTTGYVKVKLWLEVPSDGNDNPGIFVVNSDAMVYCGTMKEKGRTHQFSIEYVNRNGMVFLGNYGGGGIGESALMYGNDLVPYPRAVRGNTVDAINSIKVRMLHDGLYPVGTKIKIWGVRADA